MGKEFIERIYPTACYAIGSCTAEIFATPIYTVKTHYQTSENVPVKNILKNIYCQYGIYGFYNAVFSAMLGRLISSFLKYLIYSEIKYYRKTENSDLYNNILNGCITGTISSFFVHPVDTVTNHLQRHQPININLFKIKILYSGFKPTIVRNLLLYSVLFPVYDYNKYYTNNNILLSCLMTTAISSTILHPVEYVRTRLMAQQLKGKKDVINALKNFKTWKKGYCLNYLGNATHFSATMIIMNSAIQYRKNLI